MRTREEQIAQLKHFLNGLCPDLQPSGKQALAAVAKNFIEEAEQRVRAEIGRDSERLDWLGDDRHRLVSHASIGTYVTTESGETYVNDDIRLAIDAAREVG